MLPRLEAEVKKKIVGKNLEKPDLQHVCDYFVEKYHHKQALFTGILDKMEAKVLAVCPSACPGASLTATVPLSPDEGKLGVEGWLPQKKSDT